MTCTCAERVEQHVETLQRVEPGDRTDQRHGVGDPTACAPVAGAHGRELVGIEELVEDDHIRGIELRSDRKRHRDHA